MYCFFFTYANFWAINWEKNAFLIQKLVYFKFLLYFFSVKAQIMAIGNVTPDSFYAGSRLMSAPASSEDYRRTVAQWAEQALADGADILDIGACSTRPGSTPVSEEGEWERLEPALTVIRETCPNAVLSVDTFRPEIARRALDQFGHLIINDISGGCDEMFTLMRAYCVPYIWTLCGDLSLPAKRTDLADIDLILDPGFGFIGSTEADYACMHQMSSLQSFNRPILVGVSRKSMVYRPLGLTPETCLAATQALQFYALQQGANILRVHDVPAAKQTIGIYERLNNR